MGTLQYIYIYFVISVLCIIQSGEMHESNNIYYHICDPRLRNWDGKDINYETKIYAVKSVSKKKPSVQSLPAYLKGQAKVYAREFAVYFMEYLGRYGYRLKNMDALFPLRIIFLRFRANVNNKNQLQNDGDFSTILVDDIRFNIKAGATISLDTKLTSKAQTTFKSFLDSIGVLKEIEKIRTKGSAGYTGFNPKFTKDRDPYGPLELAKSKKKGINSKDDWSHPMYLVLDIKDVTTARKTAKAASSWNVITADAPGEQFIHVYPEFGDKNLHTEWEEEIKKLNVIHNWDLKIKQLMAKITVLGNEYWRAASIFAANGRNVEQAETYCDSIENEEMLMKKNKKTNDISQEWEKLEREGGMIGAPIDVWLNTYGIDEKYGIGFRSNKINDMKDLYLKINTKQWQKNVNGLIQKVGAKGFDAKELFRMIHIIRIFGPPFVSKKSLQPGAKVDIRYIKIKPDHPLSDEHSKAYGTGKNIRKALYSDSCPECFDYYSLLYQWGISTTERTKWIYSEWQLREIIPPRITSKSNTNRDDIIGPIWSKIQELKQKAASVQQQALPPQNNGKEAQLQKHLAAKDEHDFLNLMNEMNNDIHLTAKDRKHFIKLMEEICGKTLTGFIALERDQFHQVSRHFEPIPEKMIFDELVKKHAPYENKAIQEYHNHLYDSSDGYRTNEYDYPIFASDPSANVEELEFLLIVVMAITICCICTALILLAGTFVYYYITKKSATNDSMVHVEHV